jgi:glucose-1-phosphate thymidylyltransferase
MLKSISFIIPCAGKGSRLSIPSAKELLPVDYNTTLIDCVFNNLKNYKYKANFIFIISKEKTDLIKYLSKYSDNYDIYFVYQKSNKKDLLGAIESAENLFSEKNILILPDILLLDDSIYLKIDDYIKLLDKNIDLSILDYCEFSDSKKEKLGNVKYDENENILGIIDKPTNHTILQNENSFCWVSLGFRSDKVFEFYNIFKQIQIKDKYVDLEKNKINAKSIHIRNAIDLGVWDNIRLFHSQYEYYINLEKVCGRDYLHFNKKDI